MSRPKPNCAHCGGSLRRTAYITHCWDMLPGEPTVGWHAGSRNCWSQDTRSCGVIGFNAATGAALVADVERRGPGRVHRLAPKRLGVESASR